MTETARQAQDGYGSSGDWEEIEVYSLWLLPFTDFFKNIKVTSYISRK